MNATVNIICYRQKTLKNGEHPLMIRVSKGGKKKYRSLGISVHPDHWDFQKNRPLLKCPNRELDVVFLNWYNQPFVFNNFFEFATWYQKLRFKEIEESTVAHHKGVINKLKTYKETLTLKVLS